MRNRIWYELTQAKHNIEFTCLYAEVQRKYLRWFNIGVLICSTGGVMGWKIWDNLPMISCVIIAIISLIRLVQPHIIMSENQISNLDKICNFYSDYYNKLEHLWYDSEHGIKDTETIKNEFFLIKNTERTISSTVNELIRNKPKRILNLAKTHSDIFFQRAYNTGK